MSLSSLPSELYSAIIEQFSADEAQQALLSLTRTLPYAPIPIDLLFQSITIARSEQAIQLTRRLLKPDRERVALYVQELSLHNEWTVDAEVMVNLLRKLPRLRSLSLCIGTNFAPEHLKAIFQKPMPDLKYLSLRFRPYVQRATYQQFLSVSTHDPVTPRSVEFWSSRSWYQNLSRDFPIGSASSGPLGNFPDRFWHELWLHQNSLDLGGSYFDSTLSCLADWPPSDLPTISIVQEPMDPAQAPKISFAQPIVFFRLDSHLSELAQSPYLSSVTSFRLRIPSRPVAGPLTISPLSLPSVELLDLSTCNVFGAELTDTILARLTKLKHLILDNGALLRGEYHPEDWSVLGKGCAIAGLKRTKEREKKLKQARLETAPVPVAERRPRRGRRGVSTATISLRKSPPRDSRVIGVIDTPAANAIRKIRLYPASPSLCSFATTLPPSVPPDKHAEIREQFEKGWFEGLRQLIEVRARLYQSYRLGSTIMKFDDDAEESDGQDEVLNGLVEVSEWEDDVEIRAPALCLVGPGKSEAHEEGCAHSIAWTVWKDL